MIEIKPVNDAEQIKSAFDKNNLVFTNKSIYVCARDKDKIFGECCMRVDNDEVYIMYISPQNDMMMFDGMLRSALHVGVERGARVAFYENTECEENYEILGFIADKHKRTLNIDKLFASCKCCVQN